MSAPDFEKMARELFDSISNERDEWTRSRRIDRIAAALRAAAAEAFDESADYMQGYEQAVRRAGHLGTADTLVSVRKSIMEMAIRARGEVGK